MVVMNEQDSLHLLLGIWSGTGQGEFPTIEPFEYLETLRFSSDGRSFLHYEEKTQRRKPGQTDYVPSHWESGFIRLLPDGQVELINTQNGGRLEKLTGSLEQTTSGMILHLSSESILNDPRMSETSRMIILEGDTLRYAQSMGTIAVPELTYHVEATLKRVS
jgi:THAP4-like, heme-binding beta-barrel domain